MNISVVSPINSLGYGIASANIVNELMNLGHKVDLFPIGSPSCNSRHNKNISQALKNAETFSTNSPCIRIWHQHDMSMFVGRGAHIGFPIFELDTFTDKEKHHLRSCGCLYVCSEWAKEVVNNNIKPWEPTIHHQHPTIVKVVPLGVDTSVFTPKESKRKPTIFLNVGKWEIRKGHDVLVDIFNMAFNENDNVELWMMCDNIFLSPEEQQVWHNKYKNSRLGSKIRFIPRVETDEQVAEIMRQADCGVFPSRAEGWNLEALEMLACGKDVIATDYSAHTQFLTKANSLLVPITELEPAYDGKWFFKQGNWAKLTEETLQLFAKYMVQIHEEKREIEYTYGTWPNVRGIETANTFTWKNTANTIVSHLS